MKTLYQEYFQKSRVFVYPLLEMKRGGSITPIQSYVSWKGLYKPEDKRLICLYHLRDDREFKVFEKNKLLGNKLFESYAEDSEGRGIYIFDMNYLNKSWDNFLLGKYSQLSVEHKKKIKDFYRGSSNYVHIESYLHPEKYYSFYADILGVNESILKEVGELTDPPTLDKENLEFSMKPIEFEKIKS